MTQINLGCLTPEQSAIAARLISAALQAADPRTAVRQAVQLTGDRLEISGAIFDLSQFTRIRVVGVGKAAQAMMRGLLDVLNERIGEGLLITKHREAGDPLPGTIRVLTGGHPVPTEESVTAAQALVEFLSQGREDDLVLCLISGGGSALMTYPQYGITLADLQALTQLLLASGADIREINTLRKHLDGVKGGGLARLAAPAHVIALILSDVVGSPLEVIASGPTTADPSTYADAQAVLTQYDLWERVPGKIRWVIERGLAGGSGLGEPLPETVKPGDPLLCRVTNQVVTSNLQAAQAAVDQAVKAGFNSILLTSYLQGEAAQVGSILGGILRQVAQTGQPLARPACLIAGGETTVTLRGAGLGGRNQELALGAVQIMAGLSNVALLAFGTDGEDGPTDAAGAVVTGETLARAQKLGLDPRDYLRRNDSYHFFAGLGDLLITGPTGTNVNDLTILLAF